MASSVGLEIASGKLMGFSWSKIELEVCNCKQLKEGIISSYISI